MSSPIVHSPFPEEGHEEYEELKDDLQPGREETTGKAERLFKWVTLLGCVIFVCTLAAFLLEITWHKPEIRKWRDGTKLAVNHQAFDRLTGMFGGATTVAQNTNALRGTNVKEAALQEKLRLYNFWDSKLREATGQLNGFRHKMNHLQAKMGSLMDRRNENNLRKSLNPFREVESSLYKKQQMYAKDVRDSRDEVYRAMGI
mmetsp:Transcript_6042/g.9442  ORF Transcript_6042/g.9442 Transcript_6042/m.9442 type:complete len:201 (+) Transcript_6042:182-784(+)|eukprot:CAMPEP_0203763748 /NCGR_PEP_ID=MMETSP0098-20131031/16793_1 /ASSEMBLY_ACC=CAM_ASM_000208 /TAXON_ID=96639 /ORGANISM=" , Strain NY0313808BC1" /LENGTH=200 /DNA_ID=CAMNT_0050658925 /DNA_START=821 /DNA_END=1423 /DNA_ORIENTATION=+